MKPTRFGDYEVLEQLGAGGMGAVFRCRAPGGSVVAVKTLLLEGASRERAVRRFRREVNALTRLAHPNLTRVLDVGEQDGVPFLVMPLVEGRTLQEELDLGGPFDEQRAVRLFHKLAVALAYAHSCSVLHRDLKPANVIVRSDGEPVLVDFGLVKDEQLDASQLTRTGVHMGTPGYWPPEQMQGDHQHVDVRSDVYGLGATLYAALTGHPPYPASSWAELVQLAKRPPQPLGKVRPGVDRTLEAICMRCLERAPESRWPSADALARALALWQRGESVEAKRGMVLAAGLAMGLALLAVLAAVAVGLSRTSPEPAPAAVETPVPPKEPPEVVEQPAPEKGSAVFPAYPALAELEDLSADRDALLAGLNALPKHSAPGPVITFSPRSTVLVSAVVDGLPGGSERHEALAVAAHHEAGRVVAIGHSVYLRPDQWNDAQRGPLTRFLQNCVGWLAGKERPQVGVIEAPEGDSLVTLLEGSGARVRVLGETPHVDNLDLVIWRANENESVRVEVLERFVAEGGGVLIGTCPWGYQQVMRPRGIHDLRDVMLQNKLLAPMGLAFNRSGGLRAVNGAYPFDDEGRREAHTGYSLRQVYASELSPADEREALVQLNRAVEALPSRGHPTLSWIERGFRSYLLAAKSRDEALRVGTRAALGMVALNRVWQGTPGAEPFEVPGEWQMGTQIRGDPERRLLRLNAEPDSWQATGLYAAPNEPLRVRLVDGQANGVSLRIGAHQDVLWNLDRYTRFPEVSRTWPLNAEELEVRSPFGGLVYLERSRPGAGARFAIEGGYAAPSFDLRTPSDWARELARPGVWGELAGRHVILTLPSAQLKRVRDPEALCREWDALFEAGQIFTGHQPAERLRLVYDAQQELSESRRTNPASVLQVTTLRDFGELRRSGGPALTALAQALQHPAWKVRALQRGQVWLVESYLRQELGSPRLAPSNYRSVQLFAGLVRDFGWDGVTQALASYRELDPRLWQKTDAKRLGMLYTRLCTGLRVDLERRFDKAGALPGESYLRTIRTRNFPQR